MQCWLEIQVGFNFFTENHQEAYDFMIIATKLAEKENVLLPVMVNLDGFITSHGVESFEMLDDEVVKEFVGTWNPKYSLLDTQNPVTYGPVDLLIIILSIIDNKKKA